MVSFLLKFAMNINATVLNNVFIILASMASKD